jgi:hypothetical protein
MEPTEEDADNVDETSLALRMPGIHKEDESREHFGGIAFQSRTGVDMDRGLFTALRQLQPLRALEEDALVRELCGRRDHAHRFAKSRDTVRRLLDLAILSPASAAVVEEPAGAEGRSWEADSEPNEAWPRSPHLKLPLTVH